MNAFFEDRIGLFLGRHLPPVSHSLIPIYGEDERTPYIIDTSKTSRKAINVKEEKWPANVVYDGETLSDCGDGFIYRVLFASPETGPSKVTAVEKIDPKLITASWMDLAKVPTSILTNFFTVDTLDKNRNEKRDDDLIEIPRKIDNLTVYNWRGEKAATMKIDSSVRISPTTLTAIRQDRSVELIGQSLPYLPKFEILKESYRKNALDPNYGFENGVVAVFKGKIGADIQPLKATLLTEKKIPPLSLLLNMVSPAETRDAIALPDDSGVAYVWRGFGAFPSGSTPVSEIRYLDRAHADDVKIWAAFPDELLDVRALMIVSRDGSVSLVDIQVSYLRKCHKFLDADDAKERGFSSNDAFSYNIQYQWTTNARGTIHENTISPADGKVHHFLTNPIQRLQPVNVSSNGYLCYFKGREVWSANLKDLIKAHEMKEAIK